MLPNGANHQSLKELPKQATSGRTMRQQAFVAFNFGMRPADVARMLELRETTAYRYFQQWKKMPPLFGIKYQLARRCFRKLSHDDHRVIARLLASKLGTSEEGILVQMRKPWAIKQIVTGEWRQWPIPRKGTGQKVRLSTWLRVGLLLRKSREAKHILEMAMNQNINPFEDYPRR